MCWHLGNRYSLTHALPRPRPCASCPCSRPWLLQSAEVVVLPVWWRRWVDGQRQRNAQYKTTRRIDGPQQLAHRPEEVNRIAVGGFFLFFLPVCHSHNPRYHAIHTPKHVLKTHGEKPRTFIPSPPRASQTHQP